MHRLCRCRGGGKAPSGSTRWIRIRSWPMSPGAACPGTWRSGESDRYMEDEAMSAGAGLGADVARAIDITDLETPCFVTDLGALEANLGVLADVQPARRCTILLALKGFA